MKVIHTICPCCSVGCGVDLIIKEGKVVNTFPYKRHPINEGKNCLAGKKSYKVIHDERRLTNPLIKKNGKLIETSWDEALDLISKKIEEYKNNITFIASGKCTNEDNYALKRLAEALNGSIGHCICNSPKVDYKFISLDIEDIEKAKNIVIIGDVFSEHALIGRRVVRAKENGSTVKIFNTEEKEILKLNSDDFIKISDYNNINLKDILEENDLVIITAPIYIDGIKGNMYKKILPVAKHCNTVGATLLGIPTLNREEYFTLLKESKFLYIMGENPAVVDNNLLKDVEFLVVQDTILTETAKLADVVLPAACWAEKEGTFINTFKKIQKINKAIDPPKNVLPDTDIIKKLAEKLNIDLDLNSLKDELSKVIA